MKLLRVGVAMLAGGVLLASLQAHAQTRLRGTIDDVHGNTLSMTTRGGEHLSMALADKLGVTWITAVPVEAIKPGSYIGATAVPEPDGSLKALEVHVFPEPMRGVGEGHRPWDLAPGSTMTNATVGDVKLVEGRVLRLTYPGGEKTINIPPTTPVVTFEQATPAALTKGAHIMVTATEGASGALTATRINVGKDGLTPPM